MYSWRFVECPHLSGGNDEGDDDNSYHLLRAVCQGPVSRPDHQVHHLSHHMVLLGPGGTSVGGPLRQQALGGIIASPPPPPPPSREGSITDGSFRLAQQGYLEEYEEHRGKGSFPAMITPAYQNAKKANELASDVSTSSGRPTGQFLRAEPE